MKYRNPSEFKSRTVLLRVDLNSPVENGKIRLNPRFDAFSETIERFAKQNGVAVLTHQGRPGNQAFRTTEKHADLVSEKIGRSVKYVPSVCGKRAVREVENLSEGEIVMLENTRMHSDELPERPIDELEQTKIVKNLSEPADVFINDAYPAAHRKHASTVGFYPRMPSFHGPTMKQESEKVSQLRRLAAEPQNHTSAVIGGNKPEDVLPLINELSGLVDDFLVSGVPARILELSRTSANEELNSRILRQANEIMNQHAEKIMLPEDWAFEQENRRAERPTEDIELSSVKALDIGHRTAEKQASVVESSDVVFTKGTPGAFENPRFRYGTVKLLSSVASSDAYTVVGGGNTTRAAERLGIETGPVDHLSISGGAYLRSLTNRSLPAVSLMN